MKTQSEIEQEGYNVGYSSDKTLEYCLEHNPYDPNTNEYLAYSDGVRRGWMDWFCE